MMPGEEFKVYKDTHGTVIGAMEDSEYIGDDGFYIQEYTINLGNAIYPDSTLTEKENSKIMMDKNFEYCIIVYEKFYNIPLEYTTEKDNTDKVGK